MSSAQVMPWGYQQFYLNNGAKAAGGTITTFQAGTNNLQSTYTDETAATPNANPLTLDSQGQAVFWLRTDQSYKIVLKNAAGVIQNTTDNVSVINAGSIDKSKLGSNLAGVGLKQDPTGALAVQPDNVGIGINASNQLFVKSGQAKTSIFPASSRQEFNFGSSNLRDNSIQGLNQLGAQVEWSNPSLLPNPSVFPSGAAGQVKWSQSGEFLAVAQSASPYLLLYQMSNSVLTKLTNPGTIPTGAVSDLSWSPCGDFLAVSCVPSGTSNPDVLVYQRTGNSFALLTSYTQPLGIRHFFSNHISFSPNSDFLVFDYQYQGVGIPGVKIYERSGTTFTDITINSNLPNGSLGARGPFCWSPDSSLLMTSDWVNFSADCFLRSDSTFTLVSGPQVNAYNGNINGFCFSPDFSWFAVALSVSPYVAIFQMSGQAFGSQIANPAILPPGAAQSVNFSSNGEYLFVGDQSGTSPYMTIYQMNTTAGTATAIANPANLPAGAANYGDWSRSKKYLAIAGPVSPYLQVYQTASTLNTNALLWARTSPYVS